MQRPFPTPAREPGLFRLSPHTRHLTLVSLLQTRTLGGVHPAQGHDCLTGRGGSAGKEAFKLRLAGSAGTSMGSAAGSAVKDLGRDLACGCLPGPQRRVWGSVELQPERAELLTRSRAAWCPLASHELRVGGSGSSGTGCRSPAPGMGIFRLRPCCGSEEASGLLCLSSEAAGARGSALVGL